MSRSPSRRIAAVVLPDLLCEIALRRKPATAPGVALPSLGVVLTEADASASGSSQPKATSTLAAVNPAARAFGVRAGQTIAEAHALMARLEIAEVTAGEVVEHLGHVAEAASSFGTVVSIEAPDTAWVDITGAGHLFGGEESLALELSERVRSMGHVARVAVASGPRLAQAFARWLAPEPERPGVWIIDPEETVARLAPLPVMALPLDRERVTWLVRLGVHTIGDLRAIPRQAAAARLGEHAPEVLDLAHGRDRAPLVAHEPARNLTEQTTWDDPLDGHEPLLFVLRGLVARLSARLEGRHEAVRALELSLVHDRSIAELQGARPVTTLSFTLASPLWRADDLQRVLGARLARSRVPAPTVGLRLETSAITRAIEQQLDLARGLSGLGTSAGRGPEKLPVVVAEIAADIGEDRIGVLRVENDHRPECRSRLVPLADVDRLGGARSPEPMPFDPPGCPNRLLARALPVTASLRLGATLALGRRLYSIRQIEHDHRIEQIDWWTSEPVSRDYLRVWLEGAHGGFEALVYVNRQTGTRLLQAVVD